MKHDNGCVTKEYYLKPVAKTYLKHLVEQHAYRDELVDSPPVFIRLATLNGTNFADFFNAVASELGNMDVLVDAKQSEVKSYTVGKGLLQNTVDAAADHSELLRMAIAAGVAHTTNPAGGELTRPELAALIHEAYEAQHSDVALVCSLMGDGVAASCIVLLPHLRRLPLMYLPLVELRPLLQ